MFACFEGRDGWIGMTWQLVGPIRLKPDPNGSDVNPLALRF